MAGLFVCATYATIRHGAGLDVCGAVRRTTGALYLAMRSLYNVASCLAFGEHWQITVGSVDEVFTPKRISSLCRIYSVF